jgi:hypothetical protein
MDREMFKAKILSQFRNKGDIKFLMLNGHPAGGASVPVWAKSKVFFCSEHKLYLNVNMVKGPSNEAEPSYDIQFKDATQEDVDSMSQYELEVSDLSNPVFRGRTHFFEAMDVKRRGIVFGLRTLKLDCFDYDYNLVIGDVHFKLTYDAQRMEFDKAQPMWTCTSWNGFRDSKNRGIVYVDNAMKEPVIDECLKELKGAGVKEETLEKIKRCSTNMVSNDGASSMQQFIERLSHLT